MRLEHLILKNLTDNEEYVRKAFPFLQADYFHEYSEKLLFEKISEYIHKYNSPPSSQALFIDIDNDSKIEENQFTEVINTLNEVKEASDRDMKWLLDKTEAFCQEKAIYNGIMNSIAIINGEDKVHDKKAIPKILSDALATSFDRNIGHDFIDDAEARYEYYHQKINHIPFDIDILNKITDGGVTDKTLTVFLSGTSGGKSLTMCHMASNNLMDGRNVLYITLEMAEEKIAKRIDANVLDIAIGSIDNVPRETYMSKIDKMHEKTRGRLIVKEYPPASAGANNFRHLLNELQIKKGFVPDIIYIDYLNLCVSSRFRNGSNVNSYEYVKSIAEELRGLGVEFSIPICTATQTNRSGFGNMDVGLESTSESAGTPMTADLMIAIINNDEFKAEGKLLFKQLKNRDGDTTYYNKFFVGVDYAKMRLYNIDNSDLENNEDDRPVMDRSTFGEQDFERTRGKFDFNKFK